jgi:sugar lactone lactonase YvrE
MKPGSSDRLGEIFDGPAERLAGGFLFTEGPVWDSARGYLIFSDIEGDTQYRLRPGTPSKVEVARRETGGGNGATLEKSGAMIVCEHYGRRVVRISLDDTISVVADNYRGMPLNRCNDVVCRSDGIIYVTDPQLRLAPGERHLGFSAVWIVAPDGTMRIGSRDVDHPNGIAFSPNESTMYVSNSRPVPRIYAFRVLPDGSLTERRIFGEMPYGRGGEVDGIPDGMKVDVDGRIYATGPGGLWVWTPQGEVIGVLAVPELPANLAWGDEDRMSLFITARTSVYRVRVRFAGARDAWAGQ